MSNRFKERIYLFISHLGLPTRRLCSHLIKNFYYYYPDKYPAKLKMGVFFRVERFTFNRNGAAEKLFFSLQTDFFSFLFLSF